jgi:hypothetical protein
VWVRVPPSASSPKALTTKQLQTVPEVTCHYQEAIILNKGCVILMERQRSIAKYMAKSGENRLPEKSFLLTEYNPCHKIARV